MFKNRSRLKPNQEQELRVLAAILASSHDPRAKPLFEQMARRRRNLREERHDGFVVTVPPPDAPVDLDEDVESAWVRVAVRPTGQLVEFRVTLRGSGALHSLEGRAVEGSWPSAWRVDDITLGQAARGALTLPPDGGTPKADE